MKSIPVRFFLLPIGLLLFFPKSICFSQVVIGGESVYVINESYYERNWEGFTSGELQLSKAESYYKLQVLDTSGTDQHHVLEFIDFRVDDIQIFLPENDSAFKVFRTGDAFPFDTRVITHKNFVFPLPSIKGKIYYVYFKTRVHSPLGFVVRANIRSYKNFAEYSMYEYALLAFFYGIIFCMAVYNLVRFIFTREKLHLLYVLYVTGLALFSLSRIDGLGFQYLWPDMPWINTFSFPVSLAWFVLMSLLFAITFLDIKNKYPFIYKCFLFLFLFRITLLVMTLTDVFHTDLKLFDLLVLGTLIATGIRFALWRSSIRFFFIGYISMFLGFLIYSLQDFDIIPHSIVVYYSLNIGVFIETIFLSIAISEKTKLIMVDRQDAQQLAINRLEENKKLQENLIVELKEKEILKDKVNRELEAKVRERTEELHRKNEELALQKEKIEKMASQLDIQNYEMKKETKQTRQKVLWTGNVSFSEFKELFPDELSSLAFVSEKKWGKEDFSCIKCGNDKFIINRSNLSRKCTRCTHIESVLANTLFHGLRFPLQKALYILHFYIREGRDINVSELSRTIDLRVNTCRSFLHKIEDQLKNKSRNKNFTDEGIPEMFFRKD